MAKIKLYAIIKDDKIVCVGGKQLLVHVDKKELVRIKNLLIKSKVITKENVRIATLEEK